MNTNPQTPKLDHPGGKDADDSFAGLYYKKPEPNGTFTFQCVMRFEIDPDVAAGLLVESDSTKTVHQWLLTQKPTPNDIPYCGNAGALRASLGSYLAEKKVSQARLLLPEGSLTPPPF